MKRAKRSKILQTTDDGGQIDGQTHRQDFFGGRTDGQTNRLLFKVDEQMDRETAEEIDFRNYYIDYLFRLP